MNKERFEELVGLLLDGEISGEELNELSGMVEEDPALLEELRRQLITADQLEQYEDEQRAADAFIKGLETRIEATTRPANNMHPITMRVLDNKKSMS